MGQVVAIRLSTEKTTIRAPKRGIKVVNASPKKSIFTPMRSTAISAKPKTKIIRNTWRLTKKTSSVGRVRMRCISRTISRPKVMTNRRRASRPNENSGSTFINCRVATKKRSEGISTRPVSRMLASFLRNRMADRELINRYGVEKLITIANGSSSSIIKPIAIQHPSKQDTLFLHQ